MSAVKKFEKAMNQSLGNSTCLSFVLHCYLLFILSFQPDEYIKDSGVVSALRPKYHRNIIESDDEDELLKDDVEVFKRSPKKDLPSDLEDGDDDLLKVVVEDEDMIILERAITPENNEKSDFGMNDVEMPMAGPFVTVEREKGYVYLSNFNTFYSSLTFYSQAGIKCVSQQWRLEPKNRVSQKPNGMPPAVPNNSGVYKEVLDNLYENSNVPLVDARNRINENIKRRSNISVNLNNRSNNRAFSNNHNANGFNRNRNNWRDNRPYRNGNRNHVSPWEKDNQIDKDRLWRQQRGESGIFGNGIPYGTSKSMSALPIRQILTNNVNGSTGNTLNALQSLFQQQRPTSTVQAAQSVQNRLGGCQKPEELDCLLQDILMGYSAQISPNEREIFNNILHNIMRTKSDQTSLSRQGNMTANEVMAVAADTVLQHINTIQQNFGNKYDMNLQKEIAALQVNFKLSKGDIEND